MVYLEVNSSLGREIYVFVLLEIFLSFYLIFIFVNRLWGIIVRLKIFCSFEVEVSGIKNCESWL